jgi:hypothetical protein
MDEMKKIPEVTVLINAVYFFLSDVMIFKEEGWFHLIVLRRGDALLDKQFKSLRGARIAFKKMFRRSFCTSIIKPICEWTPFYTPEEKWFKKKSMEKTQ